MIKITGTKQRAFFELEDQRALTEHAKNVRYKFLSDTHEKVAFYRYADSAAFLFSPVMNIELDGTALTPENADRELSEFFEKRDQGSCMGSPVAGDYVPIAGNAGNPMTGNLYVGPKDPPYSAKIIFAGDKGAIMGNGSGLTIHGYANQVNVYTSKDKEPFSIFIYNGVEVATVDNILTTTDGNGNLFLADDGTYKAIPGVSGEEYVINGTNPDTVKISSTEDLIFSAGEGKSINVGSTSNQVMINADGAGIYSLTTIVYARDVYANNSKNISLPFLPEASSTQIKSLLGLDETGTVRKITGEELNNFIGTRAFPELYSTEVMRTKYVTLPGGSRVLTVNYNHLMLFPGDYSYEGTLLTIINPNIEPVETDRLAVTYIL